MQPNGMHRAAGLPDVGMILYLATTLCLADDDPLDVVVLHHEAGGAVVEIDQAGIRSASACWMMLGRGSV